MIISGIQKLSLVDFDNEVSSTIFLAGCNFRCPFCHNFEFVIFEKDKILRFKEEEIINFLDERKGYLTGVCITGGEPTLNIELKELIKKIKALGLKVKLDTNGTNPDLLIELIEEGLIDYVAVDCKNSFDLYEKTVGIKVDLDKIKKTFNYLLNSSFNYEFRTTLIDGYHNNKSIEEIGKMLKGAKKMVLQRFNMSENVPDRLLKSIEKENALEFKRILEKYIDNVSIRGY